MPALVVDRVDLGRIGVLTAVRVRADGIVLPRALPQLVEHLGVLVGDVIAVGVRCDGVQTVVTRGALQVTRDDVPAHPALGQMVQRRHPPGERVRMLERRCRRDSEAQMIGDRSHGGHYQQRVVDRYLRAGAQRGLRPTAEHVVDTQHIGDEQPVEQALLQHLRQVGPVSDVLVPPCLRLGVTPRTRDDVRHAVHVERVEDDLSGHSVPPEMGSGGPAGRLASSRWVYGSCGASKMSAAVPVSTTRPSRITNTRSATWWMTPRSWEMNR